MPTYKTSHVARSIQLGAASMLQFDNVGSVSAGVANTTVQARLVVPQRIKIYKVVANFSAIGSGGAHSFNIVVGNGAEGSVGAVDTIAPAGTVVFASDQNLAGGSADVPQVFNVDSKFGGVFDVMYDTGALLTLRAVTPASTGSLTNLKVSLLVRCIPGVSSAADYLPTPDGNYVFDPSVI